MNNKPPPNAAVRRCGYPDPNLHEIVLEWETRNPHEPEPGPYISIAEMSLRTQDSYMASEIERLHDRVYPLRARERISRRKIRWRRWPF